MSDAVRQRIDKWLWQARFFKTRSLATKVVNAGSVRVNAEKVGKASVNVAPGDVLTFPQSREVRVIRIVALASRRGPATEARTLYEDLSPPVAPQAASDAPNPPSRTGRPTKKQRRELTELKRSGP